LVEAGSRPPTANFREMMPPLVRALMAAVLAAALVAGPASARREVAHLLDIEAEDCEENVPVATAANLVAPGGDNIDLEVLVLLDGMARSEAEAIMARAALPYEALDITLLPTFRKIAAPEPQGSSAPADQSADGMALIAEAKRVVGGQRPEGTDVVYLMTNRDLTLPDNAGAAGYADCIGGIRYPTRAFAAGEGLNEIEDLGLRFYVDGAAKVAAHEIGHLLGAHHHYSNCVQGASTSDATGRDPSICTLMTNFVDLQDLYFGSFEAIVVRGHAERFAS
jgi:hypothetical protein